MVNFIALLDKVYFGGLSSLIFINKEGYKMEQKFKWQGKTVTGKIASTYVSTAGKKYFVELTKRPHKDLVCNSRGHTWPVEGSIILAEEKI
jgi:hypothetical protein